MAENKADKNKNNKGRKKLEKWTKSNNPSRKRKYYKGK